MWGGGGRPDTGWKPTCLTKWPHVNLTCWTGFQTWIAVLRQGMHYHRASRTAIVLSCMYSQKLFSHQWFCGFIELLRKSAPRGTQVPLLCSRKVPQIFTTVSVSLIPNWFYGPIAVLAPLLFWTMGNTSYGFLTLWNEQHRMVCLFSKWFITLCTVT